MKDSDRRDEDGKKGDTHITERGRVSNRNKRHECEVLVLGRLRQEDSQFEVKVGFKVRA